MRLVGLVVLGMVAGCLSPVMTFGGGKTGKEAQREQASKLTPPALVVTREWSGPVKAVKVRVWADDEYRAQNVHWQKAFQESVDNANEILAGEYGVKLEPEYKAWSRHEPSATLEQALEALAAQDAGTDVFGVIGLTGSLTLVAATFDHIGMATVGGRHLIVRGYADVFERKAFDGYFQDLSADERTSMYASRRMHKNAAVLLHELAHNLGAPHAVEPDTVMNATYSEQSRAFDGASHDTMLAAIDQRLGRAAPASPQPEPTVKTDHPILVITLDATGKAIIGGNFIEDDVLNGLLDMTYKDDPLTYITVRVDKDAPNRAQNKLRGTLVRFANVSLMPLL